jgi:hypothetical protein
MIADKKGFRYSVIVAVFGNSCLLATDVAAEMFPVITAILRFLI